MKLYVKNKVITLGGSTKVLNENNEEVYSVKGKIFTFVRKKIIYNKDGEKLYVVKNKFFHGPIKYSAYIKDAKGNTICKVKEKTGVGYTITGDNVDMYIDGKFFSMKNYIMEGETAIACIKYDLSIIADSFEVDVPNEANADFVVAIVIAIDNLRDKSSD